MELEKLKASISEVYAQQVAELERLSGLTSEEAKNILLENVEKEIKHETAMLIKDIESRAKEEGEKRLEKLLPWLFKDVQPIMLPKQLFSSSSTE